jgi:hypothetical protein
LLSRLGFDGDPNTALLPDLLKGEPSTWRSTLNVGPNEWTIAPSAQVRRFRGAEDVNEYVTRLRVWLQPRHVAEPVLVSPLEVAASVDYLNVVWKAEVGKALFTLPTVERLTRLAFNVASQEELDDRLSVVGELLKGLAIPGIPGDGGGHPLSRLRGYLVSIRPDQDLDLVDRDRRPRCHYARA